MIDNNSISFKAPINWLTNLFFRGRSSTATPLLWCASLLQAIDSVRFQMALYLQIVTQAPQHFRFTATQTACGDSTTNLHHGHVSGDVSLVSLVSLSPLALICDVCGLVQYTEDPYCTLLSDSSIEQNNALVPDRCAWCVCKLSITTFFPRQLCLIKWPSQDFHSDSFV